METSSIETRIRDVIEGLRQYFQMDGGDIEFVKFQDGVAYIKLHGCCIGCSHGMCMLYQSILERVRETAPEVTSVQSMPDEVR